MIVNYKEAKYIFEAKEKGKGFDIKSEDIEEFRETFTETYFQGGVESTIALYSYLHNLRLSDDRLY